MLRLIIFVGIPFSSKDGLKMNANARLRTKKKYCYNYSPEKKFSLLIALAQISTFQPILLLFSKKVLIMAINKKVSKSQYDSFFSVFELGYFALSFLNQFLKFLTLFDSP